MNSSLWREAFWTCLTGIQTECQIEINNKQAMLCFTLEWILDKQELWLYIQIIQQTIHEGIFKWDKGYEQRTETAPVKTTLEEIPPTPSFFSTLVTQGEKKRLSTHWTTSTDWPFQHLIMSSKLQCNSAIIKQEVPGIMQTGWVTTYRIIMTTLTSTA